MDSLTEKHLAHLAHVAPNSCCAGLQGQEVRGGMGDMGGMFSAFTILRARTREIPFSRRMAAALPSLVGEGRGERRRNPLKRPYSANFSVRPLMVRMYT